MLAWSMETLRSRQCPLHECSGGAACWRQYPLWQAYFAVVCGSEGEVADVEQTQPAEVVLVQLAVCHAPQQAQLLLKVDEHKLQEVGVGRLVRRWLALPVRRAPGAGQARRGKRDPAAPHALLRKRPHLRLLARHVGELPYPHRAVARRACELRAVRRPRQAVHAARVALQTGALHERRALISMRHFIDQYRRVIAAARQKAARRPRQAGDIMGVVLAHARLQQAQLLLRGVA
mmetsp:Transcript_31555/g.80867  ORF Transcript_31555/g.80867 Transcript_31555/m.80867 type:complete len:233 (-) Transcript_31555:1277-1975(-)